LPYCVAKVESSFFPTRKIDAINNRLYGLEKIQSRLLARFSCAIPLMALLTELQNRIQDAEEDEDIIIWQLKLWLESL